ncbi:hypothetical protein BIW11_02920 [Tropilaelaps mercedesae]|uniref:Uncharacterized protein n=1 Tax=Tropilaelaps mercedesae TaxID=418985 RepID=A0A1V9XV34_9ACAR|nr:hypothetical protein BIW11_02920 [Tropilaelaps mercedesae]
MQLKAVDGVVVDTKEECKPITISVTSGSGASVIATAPAVNPIYQQATAGLHKTCRREIKEEPCDRKASIGSNGLGAAGSASQAIAFVATSTGATSKTLTGTTESSSEGVGAQIEVSPAATTVTMEPPRAIFTPGNQKTVLPTYLPNTGNLATLLHAANTVSYIKAASAVSNSTGAGGAPHSELTVNVSSAPMVSTGGSSMVASVVRPTMVPSMTSSMVPSMGQIPLMCKPGSVVRLAASGHLVQPLTLVQQIPAAAAANGVNGGTNGVTGKAGTAGSSQPAIGQATGHTHHPHSSQQATTTQLFLAQTGPAPGGAFKAPGAGVTPPGGNQPVTSMATVITQAAPSQTGHHGTQIVAGVAPIGKVQLGGATATLSIKPVSQFPLISGQQFITTSSQSLKPVVVVSVPQTSTQ